MPKVTLVVPVYKVEKWLPQCIASIKAQTFSDWECILVDDGSPDGCPALCDAAAKEDSRFQVVHQANGGLSAARNAGIQAGRAPLLLFLDSDDCIHPRLLERVVPLQEENPQAMVLWDLTRDKASFVSACGQLPGAMECSYRTLSWKDYIFNSADTRVYDYDFIRKTGLRFDTKLGWADSEFEDKDFNDRYIAARWQGQDFPIWRLDTPVYFYRQENEDSIMHQKDELDLPPKKRTLPKPQPGYCAQLLQESEASLFTLGENTDRAERCSYLRHFIRCTAYGVWCARELGEKLPGGFYRDPRLRKLLDGAQKEKIYTVYQLPFRLGLSGLIARLYRWDETQNIWYWRFYEVFYRLFFKGWQK